MILRTKFGVFECSVLIYAWKENVLCFKSDIVLTNDNLECKSSVEPEENYTSNRHDWFK